MKVICLKLSSGEELIARQLEGFSPGNPLELQDIHILVIQPTKQGMDVTFVPWAFGAGKATLSINRDHVTALYEPGKDMADGFLSQISGIQLARA